MEVLGDVPRTISGRKGQKKVQIEAGIDAFVEQKASCCSRQCLQRWAGDLGSQCRMTVETQRYAVAAMPEVVRQEFFVRKIGELLIPKMAKGSRKEGDIITGKSAAPPPPPPPSSSFRRSSSSSWLLHHHHLLLLLHLLAPPPPLPPPSPPPPPRSSTTTTTTTTVSSSSSSTTTTTPGAAAASCPPFPALGGVISGLTRGAVSQGTRRRSSTC